MRLPRGLSVLAAATGPDLRFCARRRPPVSSPRRGLKDSGTCAQSWTLRRSSAASSAPRGHTPYPYGYAARCQIPPGVASRVRVVRLTRPSLMPGDGGGATRPSALHGLTCDDGTNLAPRLDRVGECVSRLGHAPPGTARGRGTSPLAHHTVAGVRCHHTLLPNSTLAHLHTVRPSARIVTTSERKRLADCQRSAFVRGGIVPSTGRAAYPQQAHGPPVTHLHTARRSARVVTSTTQATSPGWGTAFDASGLVW